MSNGAVTADQVLKYLKESAPDIAAIVEKTMTVGDVHQPSAGSAKKKPGESDDPEAKGKGEFPNLIAQAKSKVDKALGKDAVGDGEVEWIAKVDVTKVDPEQMMMFGWASIAQIDGVEVVDKQDDGIEVEELEKAAYDFVLYSRQHGDMHLIKGTGRMVESMMFTEEKAKKGLVALDPDTAQQLYGWWTGWKIDEPKVWAAHKRGERPELSIGGRGTRVPA